MELCVTRTISIWLLKQPNSVSSFFKEDFAMQSTILFPGVIQSGKVEPGVFHGGDVEPGVFHGGDVEPGVFHSLVANAPEDKEPKSEDSKEEKSSVSDANAN